jgi:hypothetical protein
MDGLAGYSMNPKVLTSLIRLSTEWMDDFLLLKDTIKMNTSTCYSTTTLLYTQSIPKQLRFSLG